MRVCVIRIEYLCMFVKMKVMEKIDSNSGMPKEAIISVFVRSY